MGLDKFVFGSLATILLCFFLTVKATDDCCNGYRIKDRYPVEMITVEDVTRSFLFSDDFRMKFNHECDFMMQGCVTIPRAETFTMQYHVIKADVIDHSTFEEDPMDVCDEIEEAKENQEYQDASSQMACMMKWFSGDSCPIEPKGPICDQKCGTNGKMKPEHMSYLHGNTTMHLKLKPDGILTEMKFYIEVEKCE